MSIAAERRAAARNHCARALRCRRGWYLTVSASHRRRRRGARVAQVQFITDNLGGDIHPGFSIWRYLEVQGRFEINDGQAIFCHWGGMFARS